MGRDASLDEFLGGEESGDGESAPVAVGEEGEDEGGDRAPAVGPDGADAGDGPADGAAEGASDGARDEAAEDDGAFTTYAWSPAGRCARCGASAERRWRDAGALVCGECKDW